jgi:GNAT superfamily N-acetyltransferase
MSAVLTRSITELCAADHGNDPAVLARWLANKTPDRVAQMLANPNSAFFVAEHGGVVAAVGCINKPDEIGLNYVSPAHRFAGVSRALLAAMEQHLRNRGVTTAQLSSTTTAHHFYLANGWHDAGPCELDFGMACQPMEPPRSQPSSSCLVAVMKSYLSSLYRARLSGAAWTALFLISK